MYPEEPSPVIDDCRFVRLIPEDKYPAEPRPTTVDWS